MAENVSESVTDCPPSTTGVLAWIG